MNVKVKMISLIAAVCLAGVSLITALALSGAEEEAPVFSTPPAFEPPPPPSFEPAPQPPEGFWVCEIDGQVVVCHNASRTVPIEITNIDIRSLRRHDQDMLRAGVFFTDYMDVVVFLEDFGP
jgi:hypothetical protein